MQQSVIYDSETLSPSRGSAERRTMMALAVHKKQFFKLFLAFYFLFFSISPLVYALSDKQVPEIIYAAVKKSPSIKSVHLLLWASFTGTRSSPEETPHTKGKTSVLVKKKRALAPEDSLEKLSLFKNTSVPKSDFSGPLAPTAYSLDVTPENILEIHKGFDPLYAGNSPPSV